MYLETLSTCATGASERVHIMILLPLPPIFWGTVIVDTAFQLLTHRPLVAGDLLSSRRSLLLQRYPSPLGRGKHAQEEGRAILARQQRNTCQALKAS